MRKVDKPRPLFDQAAADAQDETVFLVILEDRHIDLQVECFRDQRAALNRAAAIAAEYDYEPDEPVAVPEGWLFNVAVSGEGDYVSVRKAVLR